MVNGQVDKESFNQLPLFPCYFVNDQAFATLQEAAIKCLYVTLDFDHTLIRRPGNEKKEIYKVYSKQLQNGTFERSTLLKEVKVKPRIPQDGIKELYDHKYGNKDIDKETLASKGIKIIEDHFYQCWDDSKIYIMNHSAGYDSRLLSSIIKKCGFTNVYFTCWQPEIEDFLKIMKYQGWDDKYIIPVKPNSNSIDYYAEILDFDFIGANYCEAERFWAGPALGKKVLTDLDFDFSNVVGISALFSDETMKSNRLKWSDIGWFIGCFLFDNPSIWLIGGLDIILPFISKEWIQLMTTYKIPVGIDEFKLEMLRQVDPTMLNLDRFPNPRFKIGPLLKKQGFHPFQMISEETRKKMENSFLQSWYCNTFKKESILPFPDILKYYDSRTTEYIKAAIFEYLIDEDCNITV